MMAVSGAASAFNNAGTLIKTATAGSTTFNVAFNNSGTVDVEIGTLNLANGSLSFAGLNVLVGQATTTIAVSGDLVGATTNVDLVPSLWERCSWTAVEP